MIRVLADENLYKLETFLPKEIELVKYDPVLGMPDINGFDAWLLRSVTKVNPITIPKLPKLLKFIGTGSSGRDHIDKNYLLENEIRFVDAKGSNANVVAEYVVTSILLLDSDLKNLLNLRVGIIGIGAVGKKVVSLLNKIGFNTVSYDPPRDEKESDFESASLEKVLSCDILTFHVPLERTGKHPTYHWLNNEKLSNRDYFAIINAARGGVIDEIALMIAKQRNSVKHLIIDVWENEPDFNPVLAKYCSFATPHIAGSSIQSKTNASEMLATRLCNFFELKSPKKAEIEKQIIHLENANSTIRDVIYNCHPLPEYHKILLNIGSDPDKCSLFARLRTDFPYRNEYPVIRIPEVNLMKFPILKKFGISN